MFIVRTDLQMDRCLGKSYKNIRLGIFLIDV